MFVSTRYKTESGKFGKDLLDITAPDWDLEVRLVDINKEEGQVQVALTENGVRDETLTILEIGEENALIFEGEDSDVALSLLSIKGPNKVKIGVDAPRSLVKVLRGELRTENL